MKLVLYGHTKFEDDRVPLRQRPEFLRKYNDIIKQQVESGVIEEVNEFHNQLQPGSMLYIPHKEVLYRDKNTCNLLAYCV